MRQTEVTLYLALLLQPVVAAARQIQAAMEVQAGLVAAQQEMVLHGQAEQETPHQQRLLKATMVEIFLIPHQIMVAVVAAAHRLLVEPELEQPVEMVGLEPRLRFLVLA